MDPKLEKFEDEQYWQNFLEGWKASGLSLKKWSEQKNQRYYRARYWKRKLDAAINPKVFIEIDDQEVKNSTISIRIGRAQIEINSGFNPHLLREVVGVLGDFSC